MEVLATASSVAGVLSLTGQSIHGIIRLKDFLVDIKDASKTVGKFSHEIDLLLQQLQSVQALLIEISDRQQRVDVSFLQIHLEDCTKEVESWLEMATALRPKSGKGGASWFKKFWIVVNIKSVKDVRKEVDAHRSAIQLSLSVLGR